VNRRAVVGRQSWKSLLASARRAYDIRTADAVGIEPSGPGIDFARVMDRVQDVIRRAGVRDTAEHLESEGVEVIPRTMALLASRSSVMASAIASP
jgi:pyruvate/2-oxoglutarate dehydrogenase complex dihydrolipoamide dehydrogenase (E3) component